MPVSPVGSTPVTSSTESFAGSTGASAKTGPLHGLGPGEPRNQNKNEQVLSLGAVQVPATPPRGFSAGVTSKVEAALRPLHYQTPVPLDRIEPIGQNRHAYYLTDRTGSVAAREDGQLELHKQSAGFDHGVTFTINKEDGENLCILFKATPKTLSARMAEAYPSADALLTALDRAGIRYASSTTF